VAGEPVNENVPQPPEPKGKLDTVMVNGPQDKDLGWDAVVWPVHEELVRRLRCRIFKASKAMPDTPSRGLLEPYAATSGTYGSEGAPMQQCIGATRPCPNWITPCPDLADVRTRDYAGRRRGRGGGVVCLYWESIPRLAPMRGGRV
jgi:hypothetical protein